MIVIEAVVGGEVVAVDAKAGLVGDGDRLGECVDLDGVLEVGVDFGEDGKGGSGGGSNNCNDGVQT